MPNWRQANIWTDDDPIHWRIHAALGGGELRFDTVAKSQLPHVTYVRYTCQFLKRMVIPRDLSALGSWLDIYFLVNRITSGTMSWTECELSVVYNISHKIRTHFGGFQSLFCCGYIIPSHWLQGYLHPKASTYIIWQWDNHMIAQCQWFNLERYG